MSLKALLKGELVLGVRLRSALLHRSYATSSESTKEETVDITSIDSQPKYSGDDFSIKEEKEIEAKRNKSRLSYTDYNIVHSRRPYEKLGIGHHHKLVSYQRRVFGRYGIEGSNINPGVAWPTKEQIAMAKEYERVAYPVSLAEGLEQIAATNIAKADAIRAREAQIDANLIKSARWIKELHARVAKKEAEMKAVKERKERLVEEVRRHFGFKVDPRDDRFKEMLEQKEKEEKRRKKAAKKAERETRMMSKITEESLQEKKSQIPESTI